MIFVIVKNKVAAENRAAFIASSHRHAERSLQLDKGLLSFEVGAKDGSDEILFFERWESQECLDRHGERGKNDDILKTVCALRLSREMETYEGC